MEIVLGVSMEPMAVRLVLIEGANADGVTVEEHNFEVAPDTSGTAAAAIAAVARARDGAVEGGYQLASTGVTWTDPAAVGALREQLAARDVGSVMLVSPLLAAAALAQTVGFAIGYEHIAMLFVESDSATLAVVDVADGSIVDLHRQQLATDRGAVTAELATMLAGLDAPGSRANGVFVIGCGVDIVAFKPALQAATSLVVSLAEEPEMALARGAAVASANAPLFTSSTAALAYALDPGTGEVNPRALTPTYLDVCANADRGEGALAYSALDDDDDGENTRRGRPFALSGGVMAGVSAIAAGILVVSLTSDVRPTAAELPSPPETIVPASQAPAALPSTPPQLQPPAPSPPPAAPPIEVAAPPPVVQPPPQTVVNMAPATPRRAPTRKAPVPTPVPQAPRTTPPAAVPPPPPPPPPEAPPTPIMTMYLHLPFVSIPIPIYPPAPPPPPPEPG
ncbi:hypothetical protein B8W66_22835, partial [Mycobacterium decipiens]